MICLIYINYHIHLYLLGRLPQPDKFFVIFISNLTKFYSIIDNMPKKSIRQDSFPNSKDQYDLKILRGKRERDEMEEKGEEDKKDRQCPWGDREERKEKVRTFSKMKKKNPSQQNTI